MSAPSCNWSLAALGEVCSINPPKPNHLDDDDLVTFIPMSSLEAESGRIDTTQERRFGELRHKSYRPFEDGDVLVAKITPCMENGKVAVAHNLRNGSGFGSTEFHILRPSSAIDARYLMYFLLQSSFRNAAARHMTGTAGQLRVPTGFIRESRIPLPRREEQHNIVQAIEEKFSRLDAAENALRRSLAMVATMQAACFSTLTRVFAAPDLDDDHPDLPLPQGWQWVRASDVCHSIASGSTPRADKMYQGAGDVPFLKVYNITRAGSIDFRIKPTFIDLGTHRGPLARSRVVPGDVLMNIVGPPLGKVAVVPDVYAEWNINQAIVAFRLKSGLNSRFLAYSLMSEAILRPLLRTGKATAGQTNLSLSNSRRLWLPVPPPKRQAELVQELGHLFSVYDNVMRTVDVALRRSAQLRQAILHRAFSEKLPLHFNENENGLVTQQQVLA